jgi:hypothetical protein
VGRGLAGMTIFTFRDAASFFGRGYGDHRVADVFDPFKGTRL